MDFKLRKANILNKLDKSLKGSIDQPIRELISKINNSDNYYTTSSCSGRIVLLKTLNNKKQDSEWLLCSHDEITIHAIIIALEDPPAEPVWFKYEPPIIHACADTLENAGVLLDKAKQCSFKKSGITSVKNLVLEIRSQEHINFLISANKKLLAPEDFIEHQVKKANEKMKRCLEKINKLADLLN